MKPLIDFDRFACCVVTDEKLIAAVSGGDSSRVTDGAALTDVICRNVLCGQDLVCGLPDHDLACAPNKICGIDALCN